MIRVLLLVFSVLYIVGEFFIIAAPVHRLYPDQCKRNDAAVEVLSRRRDAGRLA